MTNQRLTGGLPTGDHHPDKEKRPGGNRGANKDGRTTTYPDPEPEATHDRPQTGWVSLFPTRGGYEILVQSNSRGSAFMLEDERKMAETGATHVSFWTEDQGVAMAVALRYCRENNARFEVAFYDWTD